jgi:Tol biopolymer transport system component
MLARIAVLSLALATPCLTHGAPGDTTVVSFSSLSGNVVEGFSYQVSADGRYTVFATTEEVTHTVPPFADAQVYLYDRLSDQHELISVGTRGEPSNGWCESTGLSADGRFVLMSCIAATNLIVGDTREVGLVLRNRVAKTTQRVLSDAFQSALSGDGRYVAFTTAEALVPGDTNGTLDVYLWDRQTLVTERVSVGYGAGQPTSGSFFFPGLSDDGRFVVFTSSDAKLVPGDTNGLAHVFVRDRLNKQTRRVSVSSNGAQANGSSAWSVISANGQVVAFSSAATNLIPGDVNKREDYFVHDLATGQTERVNVSSSGQVSRQPAANFITVSGDGRFVTFATRFPRLVPNDTNNVDDVFVRDRQTRTTVRASVNTAGVETNRDAFFPVISRDGRFVTFTSFATNLTTRPFEGFFTAAVYLHEITSGVPVPVTLSPTTVKFGTVAVGTLSDVRLVTITNTSTNAVALQAVNLRGPSPDQYSRVSRCPAQLSVGASCTVEVRFAPTTPGASTAKLIVNLGEEYPKAFAWLNGTGL